MKKLLFLLPAIAMANLAVAQGPSSFVGTSYTQDFNDLGNALPTGWRVDTGASSSSIGDAVLFGNAKRTWNDTYGNFKNVASANVATGVATDSVAQMATTDRALGVRQVSGINANFHGADPGAAFCFGVWGTKGLTGFKMSFKLQSLDSSSPRTTTWVVDYGKADLSQGFFPATFTPVTTVPATLTTGNKTFSNDSISVDFGSALDTATSPIWIRIVALNNSVGSGNRATTAIDDVNITWTGTALGVDNVTGKSIIPMSAAKSAANSLQLAYTLENTDNLNLQVFDMTGRIVYAEKVNGQKGNNIKNITLNTAAGMYIIKLTGTSYFGTLKTTL